MNSLDDLLIAALLLAASIAASQSADSGCPADPICDSSASECLGYGDLSIKCANGTKVSFGPCFLNDLCASADASQGNDWIGITATNINPAQCYAYSDGIKQNLLNAYNNWCCQGDNYLKCCPGSTGWPSGVPRTGRNCAAMSNYSMEIAYAGASGSSQQTRFFIQLRPRRDSTLCQLLVYSSGGGGGADGSSANASDAATTAAAAAAAAATNNNATTATAAATAAASTATTATTAAANATAAAATTATTANATAAAANTATTANATAAAANTATTTAAAAAANTATTTAAAAAASTATTAVSRGNTTASSGRRRRRDAQPEAAENDDATNGDNEIIWDVVAAENVRSRERRATLTAGVITLDEATVRLLITGVDVKSLVTSTILTASNYTLSVTVTVEQNVARASILSADRQSNSWVIATGTICGIIVALITAYLIACAVHRSKNRGDRLPL